MIGFELDRGILTVTPETWGYIPFKKLLDRDKTEDKSTSFMEMMFIHNYAGVGSNYEFITDLKEREDTIKHDIGLPKKWKIDKHVEAAISFYKERSQTVLTELYDATTSSVRDISNYLKGTAALIAERDKYGKQITKVSDIISALKNVKQIMRDVNSAYKEVIKEAKDISERSIGKQTFNLFEEGLEIEDE